MIMPRPIRKVFRHSDNSLTEELISSWVDAYYLRTGAWPKTNSGKILGTAGITWCSINYALARGRRGLPGGSSLATWLAENRSVAKWQRQKDAITEDQISSWVSAYHRRTSKWPKAASGCIPGTAGITWGSVDYTLARGRRGLPGGSSLATWLAENRGVARWQPQQRFLTEEQILSWADAHHERTGRWPNARSGPICGVRGEKWVNIDQALRVGARGLSRGSTLARFLAQRRGAPNRKNCPPLTKTQILAWADAYHQRTGKWPRQLSGPIPEAPGQSWGIVDNALRVGKRGLPGASTLLKLLVENRRQFHPLYPPPLTIRQILKWVDAHHQATGRWPNLASGRIEHASQETWRSVNLALYKGTRGLPGGSSLYRLLVKARGVRQRQGTKDLGRPGIFG
jgi:hypothetical protein